MTQSNPATLRDIAARLRRYSGNDEVHLVALNCATQLEALAASGTKAAPSETAWLIERARLCVGFCERKPKWVTFTDETALRFSRRSDAIRFIEAFREQLDLENVLVTEHAWSAPMKVRTDFHSVNLSTGEKTRSVVGDGERRDEVEGAWITQKAAEEDGAFVSAGCIMPAAQAAASPEGEGREAYPGQKFFHERNVNIRNCDQFKEDVEFIHACHIEGSIDVACRQVFERREKEAFERALRQSAAPSGGAAAAQHVDWMQVLLNLMNGQESGRDGQPCFHVDHEGIEERFCLRAKFWAGHDDMHKFVSLADLLAQESKTGAAPSEGAAQVWLAELDKLDTYFSEAHDSKTLLWYNDVEVLLIRALAQESKTGAVTETK